MWKTIHIMHLKSHQETAQYKNNGIYNCDCASVLGQVQDSEECSISANISNDYYNNECI